MSGGHGHEDHGGHGGGDSGGSFMGECLFGYTKEVKGAAGGVVGMISTAFLGIFGGGGEGGHDHGHH